MVSGYCVQFLMEEKESQWMPEAGFPACKTGDGALFGVPVLLIAETVGGTKIREAGRKYAGRLV